jgi:hypothetical protein
MTYKQFSELESGATITISQFREIFADSASATIKDNSVRGAATVYTSAVKVGDKVNNGTMFIEVVEDTPGTKPRKNTLKHYLDTQVGDYGYIQILTADGAFLCEGKVNELRANPLFGLINESERKYRRAYLNDSSQMEGKRNITIEIPWLEL